MPRISAASLSEHRAQTLDRVFRAFSRLSRDRAIDDISMTDVAAEAGVARTVLYNYFPDKAGLLLAFSERVTEYFVERFERELPKNAPATERLVAFVRLQLDALQAHPHPGAAEVTAALGPDVYHALAEHIAPMQRVLAEILTSGIESGEFRPVDVTAAARSVMAVIGAERIPLVRGADPAATEKAVVAFIRQALKNSAT